MRLAFSGYNPFDTLIVFLKEYFENVDILKKTSEDKTHKNFPGGEELCVISWETCLRGFRPSEFQTSLLSYRDYIARKFKIYL